MYNTQLGKLTHALARRRRFPTAILVMILLPIVSANAMGQDKPWALYVMHPDGSEVRKLVEVPGCREYSSPRWSHDGNRVAFSATASNWTASGIYIVNADGTGLRRLGEHMRPDWSPDDKQLVFDYYDGTNRQSEVCVQDLDGQGRTKLADGTSPRWSPDSSLLALSDRRNVFIMDLITGETRDLFNQPMLTIFSGFSWSPDGSQLAVVVRPAQGAPRQIWLVNAQGEDQGKRKLIDGEMGGYLSFSPDGKQLIYADGWKMRTLKVAGENKPRTVPHQKGKNREPNWSPDGKWIVFSSDRDSQ